MDEPEKAERQALCHRCLEPVPAGSARCLRCGERIHLSRSIRKTLAIFGLAMFVVIVLVAFRMLLTSSGPSANTTITQPHRPGDPDPPPPPQKEPALGQ